MPLLSVKLKPGIVHDQTPIASEGFWYDCDKVRFRMGLPEMIGGWTKYSTNTYDGELRAMHRWIALDNNQYLAGGTNTNFYVVSGNQFYDITPIVATRSLANPFTTQLSGTSILIVTDVGHGRAAGDTVIFSGATGFDAYSAGDLNTSFVVQSVLTANTYTIDVGINAIGTAVNGGGASVTGEYLLSPGNDSYGGPSGWGSGYWGSGSWGSGSFAPARVWSIDNFGEDLVFCNEYGEIYYWERSGGVTSHAVRLVDLPSINNPPTIANIVCVSDIDRHCIAMGCNDYGEVTQDLSLVRWSSQEDIYDWEPRPDNTSGSYRLSGGSQIVATLQAKGERLIWTTTGLHSMQFQGPPYTYGFSVITEGLSIISRRGAANAKNTVYWMDRENFFMYNGTVQVLPCTVKTKVFGDINRNAVHKVFAASNNEFNEVSWFYPSSGSNEVDRYVTYNYAEQAWTYGTMDRTAWLDLVDSGLPVAAGDGNLWTHENGYSANGDSISAYIESSDFDIQDGEDFSFIPRIVPDVVFEGSAGSVDYTIKGRDYPNQALTDRYTVTVNATDTQKNVRVRARQIAYRVSSNSSGFKWRAGATRFEIIADGQK